MYAPPTPRPRHAPTRRRGVVLIYSLLLLSVLIGFASFAVDFGRAQLVKSQLRRTADAAARAAVANVTTGITAAQNAAVAIAALNDADGTPVVLDPTADVEFGTWNTSTKTFSALSGAARANANALRITARRTAARGNAVPLMFARVLGKSFCDVSATAIAYATPPAPPSDGPGFVGLQTFITANITTDSYDGSAGAYAAVPHTSKGNVTSNNDLVLWNSTINGNAYKGQGDWVFGANITGDEKTLPSTLSYASPTFPATNNNANIAPKMNYNTGTFSNGNLQTWGAITLPGGTYVLNNLNCSAPITFTGPTKLYVVNDCNVNGNGYLGTYQNKPANLLIVAGSNLNLWPAQPFYADIFSPNATIATSPGGTSHFYGQIIVQHFLVYNMNLHHDTSLPSHDPTGGGFTSSPTPASSGTISLVN